MYLNDLVIDFYSFIRGKRVLVLANCDIDSVCTCKILQWLFHCDNIVYTLIPIQGIEDMITAYEEHSEEVKYVILINCGGTIDIVETLRPEEDVFFFVIDSHRPTDVCNVYNTQQVRLVAKVEDDEAIPDFDDIFHEDDESENSEIDENEDEQIEEDEEGESRGAKRRRLNEEAILRRRERRLWDDRRKRLLFEYTQFTYFGRSSAILMYELAWKLSKDNIDVLWWAIVGFTEQFVLGHVEVQKYQDEINSLQLHIGRLCPTVVDNDDTLSQHSSSTSSSNSSTFNTALKITSEKDLNLVLYRHWTVEHSLRHSMFLAVRLKLWTIKGEKRLHQLLAEMGLPLAESRQMFGAMDLSVRREFQSMMEKMAKTHDLDILFTSFTLHNGFRNRYQATDYVYAMLALFNTDMRDKTHIDGFLDALGCLSRQNKSLLDEGIVKAKMLLTIMYRQVQNSLDMKQIISAGPFLYLVIQEGTLDSRYYSQPHCLHMLAQILLRAYVATARRKSSGLPLIISAPLYNVEGTCLVLGIPPLSEPVPRNFLGKAFEQAADKSHSKIEMDFFNTAVIKMKTVDRPKFFDALTALLS